MLKREKEGTYKGSKFYSDPVFYRNTPSPIPSIIHHFHLRNIPNLFWKIDVYMTLAAKCQIIISIVFLRKMEHLNWLLEIYI